MSEKDIETVLLRIKEELDNDRRNVAGNTDDKAADSVIKERLMKGYLFHDMFTQEQFSKNKDKYKLNFGPENLVLCIMEIDHYGKFIQCSGDKEGAAVMSLFNVLGEILEKNRTGEAFHDHDGRYAVIFNLKDRTDVSREIIDFTKNIGDMLKIYFDITVSFGVSGVYNGYGMLKEMYRQAAAALEVKFFAGSGLFLSRHQDFRQQAAGKINKLKQIAELRGLLGAHGYSEYIGKVDEIAQEALESRDKLTQALCRILQWITLNGYSLFSIDASETVLEYSHRIEKCETLEECIETVAEFVRKFAESMEQRDIFSSDIAKAMKYIQQNYASELTLNQVAGYVNMSAGYFSNLFKKETNVNFIEYLNKLRVEKAEKLLRGTSYKSFEIAEKVGFADNTYFCKVFKKMTGMSPSRYRSQEEGSFVKEEEDDPED
jgi:two-component system response regulator YesN